MRRDEEAQNILDRLSSMPFEECCPLSREFLNMPTIPGLYALRHRDDGILYIGLAINLRRRFKDGHKAFLWALLDCYSPYDVGIAVELLVELLTVQSFQESDALETRMTRIANPSYNVRKK